MDELARQANAGSENRLSHKEPSKQSTDVKLDVQSAAKRGEKFEISEDVSFLIEVQQSNSLAEQIQQLQRLCDDGIITQEELSVAKAKLLD